MHLWMVLTLAGLVAVTNADWEVLNGGNSESRTDGDVDAFNLKQENLLPVDAVTKRELKTKERNLSSLDQNETEKSHPTVLKVKIAQKQDDDASTAKSDSTKTEGGVKTMASQHASLSETEESPKSDDVINFAEEGLLSLEKKKNHNNVHSGRKLAQLKEQSSDDVALRNNQKQKSEKDLQNEQTSLSKDDLALANFKVACVYENSWECIMFKEDFLAMQGDDNISRRATALERAKRQSAPAYGQPGAVKNHGNTRNLLLDCDGYTDCFSGDGNDTVDEPLDLQIKGRTRTRPPKGVHNPLTDAEKDKLAKDMEKQLKEIFKDIPGFKGVTVDPKNIYYDTNETIAYDGWVVHIDSSNNKYTNQTAPDVGKIFTDALKNANGKYNNISVLGEPPLEPFNFTKAVDDVVQQVSNPCEKTPSPCPYGYGHCRALQHGEKKLTGINVECTDNCVNFDNQCAMHGQCDKDKPGKAFCKCSQNWAGLYCDKDNNTANKDISASANYTVKMHSTFKTNLTSNDLTPAKRKELADTLSKKLNEIMKAVPGLQGITVDPNTIEIQDGKLVIPWDMKLNPAATPEFTGKSTEQISDIFRAALQNVSGIYRSSLLIDGLEPIDGLDITNATDQVIAQANDPCSTNPCSSGYGNCEVVGTSTSEVKCIHNCNAHPGLCQNDGSCMLNSLGNASCQCTSGWTGQNCESQASKKLDDGKIAGVAIGALLIAAGIIGAAIWFFLFANRNKDIGFTNYTDNEGAAGNSNAGKSACVIDRPQVSPTKLPLFTQSAPNSRNFSRTSSHETPNSSGGSAGANPFSWA